MTVSLQDPLAEGWYANEPSHPYPEIAAAQDHGLRPGATVFDIGAHQAVVALVLADLVGPEGRVVAVEGNNHNAQVARDNIALNEAVNVTVVEAACTSRSGEVAFHEELNGRIATGRLGARLVRAVTVDELSAEYGMPDVVYLDIEGSELAALRGAACVIASGRTFVIEVHAGHELQAAGGSVREIGRLLDDQGYQLLFLAGDGWRADTPMRPITLNELPEYERFFLLAYR